MSKFESHDDYIAAAPEHLRPMLIEMRSQLSEALPDAEELISYDIPGFGFGNTVVAGYAAFSRQCGLYIAKGAIEAHADEIAAAGLKASKTGVTFLPGKPIPADLLVKLALSSRSELSI